MNNAFYTTLTREARESDRRQKGKDFATQYFPDPAEKK